MLAGCAFLACLLPGRFVLFKFLQKLHDCLFPYPVDGLIVCLLVCLLAWLLACWMFLIFVGCELVFIIMYGLNLFLTRVNTTEIV